MLDQTLNSRYTVTAHIGGGAMADVFQAADSQTNQTVGAAGE